MIKVSIIVPIYNVEKYLRKCLDSLVNQTLQEIEILLVNDKSPDQCDLIMEEYKERFPDKVKCFYQPTNQKQGAARNVGIKKAEGEYLVFVDSDDWLDITMCEKMYECAKRENAELVFCDYIQVFENKTKQRYIMDAVSEQAGEVTVKKLKSLFPLTAYPFARLVSRKLVIDNKLYFAENIKYEDKVFVPFLPLYSKKIGKVNEGLYYYLQRESSTVNSKNEVYQFDRMKASEIAYLEMKKRGFYKEYKEEIDFCFVKDYYLMMLRYCIEKFDEPPINKMKELDNERKIKFSEYKNNYYIDKFVEPIYLKIAEFNENSTDFLVNKYRDNPGYFKEDNYLNYYTEYRTKIINLLSELHKQNKRVAIWGAGQKGIDFLRVCDSQNERIDYVIDGDKKKENTRLSTGHIVQTYEKVKDSVDSILVINRYHYGEIYNEIRNKADNSNSPIINLDNYLVFDLS